MAFRVSLPGAAEIKETLGGVAGALTAVKDGLQQIVNAGEAE
jgi:hypothetical protein